MGRHGGRFIKLLLVLVATLALSVTANDAAPPVVLLETTAGDIVIELHAKQAPLSVASFLGYVDAGFYDGLVFHRIAPNFVIQAGGYDRDMQHRAADKPVPNESANGLKNVRGSVALARLEDPDSATSQFFINVKHNAHLDATASAAGYTVFGTVTAGMDVVDTIELVDTGIASGMAGVPIDPVVIERATRVPPASAR